MSRAHPPSEARQPSTDRPARIEALATLPLFHKVAGRRVVLAGASEGVAWKAELLAAAGAEVELYAPRGVAALDAMVDGRGEGEPGGIRFVADRWTPAALNGAALAIADLETDAEAEAFARAARAAGAPVNIVDKPRFCDFQFGSVVNRSPLVIAISTDGAAPVFGQAVRARIEAMIPLGFRRWAEAAKAWRPLIAALELPFRSRRAFWERFTATALAAPDRVPGEADRGRLLALAERLSASPPLGSVAFVGAGPGDPELVTMKAVRLLQSADVVLYDDLVSPEILELSRREAERIAVGKRGYRLSCRQGDITSLIVELASQGKRVVRLKGGDPGIFGRLAEELAEVRAAGIPFEVAPGITAASGAAASLGMSLTHRGEARRVQYITAHARDGSLPSDLNWAALADPLATTVVYMGVHMAQPLLGRLLEAGLPAETPVALVESATRAEERVVRGVASSLPALVAELAPRGPCLMVIGAVAAHADPRERAERLGPDV
ncbi:siroheme synthase CysG [Alsobacter sp. SYSU M60028]|uniref:Siroheme synthase CysG n=1 Tax=Alsobacter ponti TaxID=2962936 RepID=A0ABT1LIV5_9HYPH|nr:siroheme synthase CysG [Alsobacter ponti]MCP8940881.1 siroheme synthase CysG [Alsobacter ponti]